MASSSLPQQYDVFLSFRGVDTRKKFVSHLYHGLQSKGIRTFKDDRDLHLGDSLPCELPRAIKESKFAVIVISESYASSRWCLMELEMIMELKKNGTLDVIPIFYEVDPSDVRKQSGIFAEAFQKHDRENPEKVNEWREALSKVADLTGVDSRQWLEEATMVCNVVGDISRRLFSMSSKDATDIIGMDTQLEALGPLSSIGSSDEVSMIGIWGMGGVGKTTIAKYLYKKFSCQFPFHCFIEKTKKINGGSGLESLRREFLFQILNDENLLSPRVQVGSNEIQKRLRDKKILAILDDVDDLEQLEAVAKQSSWFGPGSLIIITTRDKGLLLSREIKLMHVKCFEQNAACGFFNHFAFSGGQVPNGFERLVVRASDLVGGLPLALKVLGLFLRGREIGEWEVAIRRLRDVPRKAVMECLKVSYDGLTKENQSIFLTVACLFNEEHASRVSQYLEGEEREARDSLHKLVEKALIDISNDGKVAVHDLIREMAKEIANNEPGRHKYLVDSGEIFNVLAEGTGTDAIEGISLDMSKIPYFPLGSKGFENMQNLKYLKIHNTFRHFGDFSQIRAAINHLPRGLILLDWHACPLTSLPSTFHAKFLVELCLARSEIEKLSEGILFLGNLRRMDLCGCDKLREILILDGAAKLEKLDLSLCTNLVKVPPSFSHLEKLTWLSMRDCEKLESLPSTAGLNSLKVVDLGGCVGLKIFPELPKSVVEICISRTSIREVPESIQNLVALEVLDLSMCKELLEISSGIGNSTALKSLNLSECRKLLEVPNRIGNLWSVEELNLRNCKNLRSIPGSIGNLTGLKDLDLSGSKMLSKIPNTIGDLTALTTLDFSGCETLLEIPSTIRNLQSVKKLCLQDCEYIRNIPDTIGNLASLETVLLEGLRMLSSIPSTIGNLSALKTLSLSFCPKLLEIPSTLGNLTALNTLNLFGCETLLEIPSTIGNLQSVKELCLRDCKILRNIPDGIGNLQSIKKLCLQDCKYIRNIPDTIGNLASLETVLLEGLRMLSGIPSTIGNLSALKTLSLSFCPKLLEIPSTLGNLTALNTLNLFGCEKLLEIPSTIGNLIALNTLCLINCETLSRIPSTIGNLTGLETLELLGCTMLTDIPITMGNLTSLKSLLAPANVTCVWKILNAFCRGKHHFTTLKLLSFGPHMEAYWERGPEGNAIEVLILKSVRYFRGPRHCISLSVFPHLRKLSLRDLNIREISDDLGCLQALQILDLSGNTFEVLPKSIKQLSLLEELVLSRCENLRIMPELPLGVKYLYANDCLSLESVSNVLRNHFLRLVLKNCVKLGQDCLLYVRHMISMPFRPEKVEAWACFSASKLPDCFYNRRSGQVLTLYCPRTDSSPKPVGFVAGVLVRAFTRRMSGLSIHCHWHGNFYWIGRIHADFKSLPSHVSDCDLTEDLLIVFSYNLGEENSCNRIYFYFAVDSDESDSDWSPLIEGCGIRLLFTVDSQQTHMGEICWQDVEEEKALDHRRAHQQRYNGDLNEEEAQGLRPRTPKLFRLLWRKRGTEQKP